MNRIVVTGATSMLGTALTESVVSKGIEVYAIVRKDTKRKERIAPSSLVHIIYGSLERLSEIEGLPSDCDVFYHFAWAGTDKENRDVPEIQERNIQYTLDAVELAKRAGCHRFVGAGSQAEYGPVYGKIDENTRFAPISSYGVSKYAAGILSKKLCERYGIDHVWGRVFSVYGPHDNKDTMLEYAIRCWNNGETARFSSALQKWNYLYESDAGEMFYRMGNREVLSGSYFVAAGKSLVLREYIEMLMDAYGEGAKGYFSETQGDILPGLEVDMEKTINALGYIPQVSFKTGIRKMTDALMCRHGR